MWRFMQMLFGINSDQASQPVSEVTEAYHIIVNFTNGETTDVRMLRAACDLMGEDIREVIRSHNRIWLEQQSHRQSA